MFISQIIYDFRICMTSINYNKLDLSFNEEPPAARLSYLAQHPIVAGDNHLFHPSSALTHKTWQQKIITAPSCVEEIRAHHNLSISMKSANPRGPFYLGRVKQGCNNARFNIPVD